MAFISNGFNYATRIAGRPLRIRYYTETIGSVWDDERTLTGSGDNLYISGLIQEVISDKGSDDAVLMEEGRLRYGDSKVYINGSVVTTSGTLVFTLAISGNSANEIVYREILPGVHKPQFFGDDIYKVIYLRELNLGSLF